MFLLVFIAKQLKSRSALLVKIKPRCVVSFKVKQLAPATYAVVVSILLRG